MHMPAQASANPQRDVLTVTTGNGGHAPQPSSARMHDFLDNTSICIGDALMPVLRQGVSCAWDAAKIMAAILIPGGIDLYTKPSQDKTKPTL